MFRAQTFHAQFHARVVLPSHLEADELTVNLIGESCVPEVAITEPIHATRETPCLTFPRTLIDEGSCKYFTFENIGYVKAKVIVEIVDDPNNVFTFFPSPETHHLLQISPEYCNGCLIIYLFDRAIYIYMYLRFHFFPFYRAVRSMHGGTVGDQKRGSF